MLHFSLMSIIEHVSAIRVQPNMYSFPQRIHQTVKFMHHCKFCSWEEQGKPWEKPLL